MLTAEPQLPDLHTNSDMANKKGAVAVCVWTEAGRTIIFMRYIFFSTWLRGTLSLVCMCFTMQMYVNKSNTSTENLGR